MRGREGGMERRRNHSNSNSNTCADNIDQITNKFTFQNIIYSQQSKNVQNLLYMHMYMHSYLCLTKFGTRFMNKSIALLSVPVRFRQTPQEALREKHRPAKLSIRWRHSSHCTYTFRTYVQIHTKVHPSIYLCID